MPTVKYRFAGESFRAERERQGLSREELAVRLGCSVALIGHVENGHHGNPSAAKAARFAAALGRRVDDFIVVDDEPVPA